MCSPADVPINPTLKAKKMIKSYESRVLVDFFEFVADQFDKMVKS
jgi:hypothetical protein